MTKQEYLEYFAEVGADKMNLYREGVSFVQIMTTGQDCEEFPMTMIGSARDISAMVYQILREIYLQAAADGVTVDEFANGVAMGIRIGMAAKTDWIDDANKKEGGGYYEN